MRTHYLNYPDPDNPQGSRGGIYHDGDPEPSTFSLEIGNNCACTVELFAIAILHDEILEYLETCPSFLGELIRLKYRELTIDLTKQLNKSRDQLQEPNHDN